jgi:3-phenylpropionate/trans-cinnamate dioxygenase ferredoxin subunit
LGRHVVADVASLPPGTRRVVKVNGREIGLFNVDGRFYAIANRCAHQGGPLCSGLLLGQLTSSRPGEYDFEPGKKLLECPWHGWEYDLETGQSWVDPAKMRVKAYPVAIESGKAVETGENSGLVKGPYFVETFPVHLDHEYLVIEMRDL